MNNTERELVNLKTYRVDYELADGQKRTWDVSALDAIDAKHLVEFHEGGVVVKASARRVR
jgi:hypothetical protein